MRIRKKKEREMFIILQDLAKYRESYYISEIMADICTEHRFKIIQNIPFGEAISIKGKGFQLILPDNKLVNIKRYWVKERRMRREYEYKQKNG